MIGQFGMSPQESLIDQLEDAVSGRSLARRADMLKRVTDLFLSGSGRHSRAEIDLFEEVMTRLIDSVEIAARAQFGSRLAEAADAPGNVMRLLAFDREIEVAGPVLSRSGCLSEQDLIRNAETMSQRHLLAISKRRELKEGLTDVLVTRGDRAVLVSTATNPGCRFSSLGLSSLVEKAGSDDTLALSIWARQDIPRQQMVRLFRQASEGLRLQLEAANPLQVGSIRAAIALASERLQAIARAGSSDFRRLSGYLEELHSTNNLDEGILDELVRQENFDGVAAALSLMCDLPIATVERALAQGHYEQVLLFAKAAGLSWNTTLALIKFQAYGRAVAQSDADQYFASYSRMRVQTAQTALQFYRLREASDRPTMANRF
ncbi:DUF2336 domain-containing protein [Bradyrhizobium japonicum]|uniref:DUF2336 domain-containing protein n=1 Tax=Bradyrhizobium japonicum TaxID=375 RepID=UPI000421864A|nr:DUF2336 domain-containing protein [Bradyrhizobium japonicum]